MTTPGRFAGRAVVPLDDLEHTAHAHEVEGADLGDGDVPFSVILVHGGPGTGPRVHRHPYPEVFVVEAGEATFRLGDEDVVVGAGHVVVSPSGVPHGFRNTGTGDLRLTAIHGAGRFDDRVARGRGPRLDVAAARVGAYDGGMYFDALSFLEDERDTFRPYEALMDLTDEQLERPVEAAHGWTGRDLMGHLLSGQEWALAAAKELAVGETSATKQQVDRDWDASPDAGDRINAEHLARFAALPIAELRSLFGTTAGELRGYLPSCPSRAGSSTRITRTGSSRRPSSTTRTTRRTSRRSWRRRSDLGERQRPRPARHRRGGRSVEAALDALDAEPLDPAEAEAGAAAAGDEVDEALDERVEAVIDDLGGVERRRDGDVLRYVVGDRVFATLDGERLETGLDTAVAKAALRTPDTAASPAGDGWIAFTPRVVDRYALDRAEAWVRFAHRRASGR